MDTQAALLGFEGEDKTLLDYVNAVRRRKRVAAITAMTVLFFVMLVTFLLPATYRSESIILIEQQDIPSDLVRTTITSYAEQRIQEIRQRIMTIGNIMDIVEEFSLYSERELQRKTRTEIAREFRDAVSIDPISAEVVDPRSGRPSMAIIAFSLSFDGGVPSKVQKVTNEITTLYLDENLKERTKQTKSTSDFLSAEVAVLSKKLAKLDNDIAEFKEQNKGALPESHQFNRSVVDRSELQISDLIFRIKELEKRKIQLEGDLTQLSPTAPIILATGEAVLGEVDRLKALQSQLRQYEASYHDSHPDILRLKREIEALLMANGELDRHQETAKQLQAAQQQLADMLAKYTADHPAAVKQRRVVDGLQKALSTAIEGEAAVKPDNPAYLVLKTRLQATEEDIRVNKEKISDLGEKIERYEGYLSRAPQVEKQQQRLLRDYHNTQLEYQEIHAKRMAAELAQNLESERKGERFTLIQPPELPIDPVSPNRVALVLLGAILASASGLGAVFLLEAMDDAVYGLAEASMAVGVMPLVAIGHMETAQEQARHQRKRVYIVMGLVAFGLLSLLMFHLFVKPLDVTWYVLLRKLGIQ